MGGKGFSFFSSLLLEEDEGFRFLSVYGDVKFERELRVEFEGSRGRGGRDCVGPSQ